MRVLVRHGHFAFYPSTASDITRFCTYFKVKMKRDQEFYTFPELFEAPHYSIAGQPYLNLVAVNTFEGKPWEVMRANSFVYSLSLKMLVPKATIVGLIELPLVGYYFRAAGSLIQPGSRTVVGGQVLSYDAQFIEEGQSLRVSEYAYE